MDPKTRDIIFWVIVVIVGLIVLSTIWNSISDTSAPKKDALSRGGAVFAGSAGAPENVALSSQVGEARHHEQMV